MLSTFVKKAIISTRVEGKLPRRRWRRRPLGRRTSNAPYVALQAAGVAYGARADPADAAALLSVMFAL